jgi:phenylpropionate dioxygenase-like ring-hydroxylating dioxygenase large terminal subunit
MVSSISKAFRLVYYNICIFNCLFLNTNGYIISHNINPLFNNWNCLGIKDNIDFTKPHISNVGELPLVTWKDSNNKLHTSINICKHMGSTFDKGSVSDGCLTCPYHGLTYSEKDKVGVTIEHEGKVFWSYLPNTYQPDNIPFYGNKNYKTSFIEIDMECSLMDSAYNTMDLLHPAYVHSGILGFGNKNPPHRIKDHEYKNTHTIGLSFEYQSTGLLQKINKNTPSTLNYHMFKFPCFTWSRVTFNKNNHLIVGVNLLPIGVKKTRWFITVVHNYMKQNYIEEQFMKSMAMTILLQDQNQMKNQYKENDLKKTVVLTHRFPDEKPIHKLHKLYRNITYPNLMHCIDLYNDYKMRF